MIRLSAHIGCFLSLFLAVELGLAANSTKPNVLVILVDDLGMQNNSIIADKY